MNYQINKELENKTKIVREWQLTESNGNIIFFDATVQGLRDAMSELDAMSDEDRDESSVELYQRHMRHDGWDWEVEDSCHYELYEKMPTKKLQSIVNKNK